ncbi:DNA polymerase epsilon catalytic subunit A [Cymbomonas tetramitiformis]|uniref:DNA polymerase epsilon catalytic subunit n=1 Tax=Cymbomonas tetramitiformis TaxID=36881 RepID=A0AAE0FW92_9CHLO|nr:DNA polymerase epsilon catalytic subunit A [Cymbomonas tetramitiformis]
MSAPQRSFSGRGSGKGKGSGKGSFAGGGKGGKSGKEGRGFGGKGKGTRKGKGKGGEGKGNGPPEVRHTGFSRISKQDEDALESSLGFENFTEGEDRVGWLMNISTTSLEDKETGTVLSAINCYFMCQDGDTFKAHVKFFPYFYVAVKDNAESEIEAYLRRKYEGKIAETAVVPKEDLDLKNHLSGLQRPYLKISFYNVQDLMEVRKEIHPIVARNVARSKAGNSGAGSERGTVRLEDYLDSIVDIREYDVPYHVRFEIDTGVRCAMWYTVKAKGDTAVLERRKDMLGFAEVRVCAFDIETSKLPLQFPNAATDHVMMISYMLDKQGYLIVNREYVGEDIDDFEYTPKPEFQGPFIVWNEPDERSLLRRWFDHMQEAKPGIYVTYNGDWFDWPFIEQRAEVHGMDMYQEVGFRWDKKAGEVRSNSALHLDALCWVKRDSYLPQGSQGLKAVTKAKLGYDPLEVDPEDMVRLAWETPQMMASYSVSDAVCTYYLYMKYVHPFILSLSMIIPMSPDEVLRKGSGTLCEALLMVEAYEKNIICPNKYVSPKEKMHGGKLLESETYIGGHVECLHSGIYRADLPCQFRLKRRMLPVAPYALEHRRMLPVAPYALEHRRMLPVAPYALEHRRMKQCRRGSKMHVALLCIFGGFH